MMKLRNREWLGFLFLFLISVVAYCPQFSGPFVYDDLDQILENPSVQSSASVEEIIFNDKRPSRVLQNISFALNWRISGNQPWSYKVFNFFIHFISALLVYFLFRRTRPDLPTISWVASFLFLIHPLQTQAVNYAMGRSELLLTFLLLLMLNLSAMRSFRGRQIWIAVVVGLATFAKESAVLFPLVFLLFECLIHKKNWRVIWKEGFFWIGMTSLVGFCTVFYLGQAQNAYATTGFQLYPPLDYLLAQAYYYLFSIQLFFVEPLQSLIHPFRSLSFPTIVVTAISLSVFGISCAFAAQRLGLKNWFFFWLGTFLLLRLPTSGFFQMINPFAEYRLYPSHLCLVVGFVALGEQWWGRTKSKWMPLVAALGFAVYFGVGTFHQSALWSNARSLYSNALSLYPDSSYLQSYVANLYQEAGDLEPAIAHYEKAILLMSREAIPSSRPIFMLSLLYYEKGNYFLAEETLNKINVAEFNLGKPPEDYFQLKKAILKKLNKKNELAVVEKEFRHHYPRSAQ